MIKQHRRRSVTCYNLIFPIWLLFLPWGMPVLAFFGFFGLPIMLVANFAIDFGVTALGMRLAKVQGIKDRVWEVIMRVWLLGYAADILGSLPLMLILAASPQSDWWYQNIEWPICYGNSFAHPLALVILLVCLLLSAGLIYLFNMRWGLKNAGLEPAQKRQVAICLAVLTAPYFLLLPTSLIY